MAPALHRIPQKRSTNFAMLIRYRTEDNTMMDIELCKTIISQASGRPSGLMLRIARVGRHTTKAIITIRETKPGLFVKKQDGRVGFHVNGNSYITIDGESGTKFMDWLESANKKVTKEEDYGHPEGCDFVRCN